MSNVLAWLEDTATRMPDKVAVQDPASALTFSELERAARSAATFLVRECNHAPRTAVALYLDKSPLALASMLGCMYARGHYCVIDTRQPASRVERILQTLEPCVVLADASTAEGARKLAASAGIPVQTIEEATSYPEDAYLLSSIRVFATDTDPLYVNFTSGSTGTPKGVVVAARSVTDFIRLRFIDFPIFNVADILVTCGIAYTVVAYWRWESMREREEDRFLEAFSKDGSDNA